MQYRFTWLIDTKNYQSIVCAVEDSFASCTEARAFGRELLNSIDSEVIGVYSPDIPVWFIR